MATYVVRDSTPQGLETARTWQKELVGMAFVSKVDVVAAVKAMEIDEVAAAAAVRKIRKMPAPEINDLGDRAREGEFDSEAAVADKDSYQSCAAVVAQLLVSTSFHGTSQEEKPQVETPAAETTEASSEVEAAPSGESKPENGRQRRQARQRKAAAAG